MKLCFICNIIIFCLFALIQCENYEQIYCHDVPFCNRNMFWDKQTPVYYIDSQIITISPTNNQINGVLKNYNSDYIFNAKDLQFTLLILKKGIFRVIIKPFDNDRFELDENDSPLNITSSLKHKNIKISKGNNNLVIYYFSNSTNTKYELDVSFKPFQIEYRNDNKKVFEINSKNLFDIEFPPMDFVPNERDSMTTVKMDIKIPECVFLTGLPERSSRIALADTEEDLYYHFYNIDMYKYKHLPYSGLYGFIPYLMSHSHGGEIISGFIWNNPSETFIGVKTVEEGKEVIFLSENGIFDFSFWGARDFGSFYQKFQILIDKAPIPPLFSLGYHQSRFSYKSKDDVEKIDNKFDEYEIPYDTLWFDIDHTIEKRYFTWNSDFDGIEYFLKNLEKKGREVVLIIDPHIKVDKKYFVYAEALKKKYFITHDNKVFVGKCWCDEASYLDFYNKEVREFWKELHNTSNKYFFNSKIINIWNDMNEPSVFETERNTIPKSALINYNNIQYEHRVAHNIYGYLMHKTTYEALLNLSRKRPFILTRSFYLGSHKYSSVWIGDAQSNFQNLELSIPMLLSLSLSGYSFVGADVGGFADNVDSHLLYRWYQLGVFYPFFRGHSHSHSYRREPWLYNIKTFNLIKKSIILRYQILPYIYNQFYVHYTTGMPIMRPVWFSVQNELTLGKFANVEFFFGASILVRPVINTSEDRNYELSVYLPEDERWYDFYILEEITKKGELQYKINKDTIGVFIKGGCIIPKKMRLRRSSKMMKNDPYTLIIALDANYQAKGFIYLDDQYTRDYQDNIYSYLNIEYSNDEIIFKLRTQKYKAKIVIEKIIIIGRNKTLIKSNMNNGKELYQTKFNQKVPEGKIELIKLNEKLIINGNLPHYNISLEFN